MGKAFYNGKSFNFLRYMGKKYRIKIDKSKGVPLVVLVPVKEDKKD